MTRLRFGTNMAVFFIFFGISLLDAFQLRSWPWALFWMGIGLVFLFADRQRARPDAHDGRPM